MKVTISAPEPLILRDAKPGDVFLLHVPGYEECVFARLLQGLPKGAKNSALVCVGCRFSEGDPSYRPIGACVEVNLDSPITLLDQVEPAAFRGRPHPQPQVASAAARDTDSCAAQPQTPAEKGMAEHLRHSIFYSLQRVYATPPVAVGPQGWPAHLSHL